VDAAGGRDVGAELHAVTLAPEGTAVRY
jgi:hypothetical protein